MGVRLHRSSPTRRRPRPAGLNALPPLRSTLRNKLIAFARDSTRDRFAIRFAGETVRLALGSEHVKTVRAVDLSDPKNWQLRSRSSKVSPAPPRRPAPSGLAGLTQVAIQPDGIDSCIQCFVVDLYLDEQHPIVAIRLDRFAP